jgi:hypothetical protein
MQTRFTHRIVAAIMLLGFVSAHAALISRVTSFTDGEVLFASDLNSEFNNLVNGVNAIDNDNIASGANISPSKLSATIAGAGIGRDGATGVLEVNDDNSTLEISGDTLQVKDDGITVSKIAEQAALSVLGNGTNATANVTALTAGTDGHVLRRSGTTVGFGALGANTVDTTQLVDSAVTTAKILSGTILNEDIANGTINIAKTEDRTVDTSVGIGGIARSASSGNFNIATGTETAVTNLSVTIITSGKPVQVKLESAASTADAATGLYTEGGCSTSGSPPAATVTCSSTAKVVFVRNGTDLVEDSFGRSFQVSSLGGTAPAGTHSGSSPCGSFTYIDDVAAGTYTYTVEAARLSSGGTLFVKNCKLVAYEL